MEQLGDLPPLAVIAFDAVRRDSACAIWPVPGTPGSAAGNDQGGAVAAMIIDPTGLRIQREIARRETLIQ